MTLRPMSHETAGERAFVAKSWVASFSSSDMAKMLTYAGCCPWMQGAKWSPGIGYWVAWNELVSRLLDRSTVTVAESTPGMVDGFLAYEPWGDATAVHYVYVRLSARSLGVARKLLDSLPVGPTLFTHRSRSVTRVPEHWRFSMAPLFGLHERVAA